jgi:UDP-GlcNAc:undecaprenyl-phosphate GlcNAc-1-phosphate transferase
MSAGLSLALTPAMGRLARAWGLVDRPDGRRKIHDQVTPVAGGLAVTIAAIAAVSASMVAPGFLAEELAGNYQFLLGILLGVCAIAAVGVIDDFGRLRGRHKLVGQAVATIIVIGSGLCVRQVQVFGWDLDLGPLAMPFTLFWLLGAINSINLLDGMDGLLGSIGVIVCLTLATLAAASDNWAAAAVAVALGGALVGFLRYNLPPASIFLGDCGSMVVGLVIGTLAIQGSLKAPTTIVLAAPVVLLTLPLFDTAAAILRRKLTGRSIYTTDRGHLHHCLLRSGLSRSRVLMVVSLLCLSTALSVLASRAFDNDLIAILTGASVVAILIVTRLFGHAETVLVHQSLLAMGTAIFRGRKGLLPRQLEVRLQGSVAWTRLWRRLTTHAAEVNLRVLRLDVNAPSLHESYHARWDRWTEVGEFPNHWRAEIPLRAHGISVGTLEVAGPQDDEPVWRKILAVTGLLEEFALELSMEALDLAAEARETRNPRAAAEGALRLVAPSPYLSTDKRNVL